MHKSEYCGTGFWEKKEALFVSPLAIRQEARLKSVFLIKELGKCFKWVAVKGSQVLLVSGVS